MAQRSSITFDTTPEFRDAITQFAQAHHMTANALIRAAVAKHIHFTQPTISRPYLPPAQTHDEHAARIKRSHNKRRDLERIALQIANRRPDLMLPD